MASCSYPSEEWQTPILNARKQQPKTPAPVLNELYI